MAAPNDLGVGFLSFFQSCEMSLGDDQYMGWGLRVDVFKGEYVRVFVNFSGSSFAADDAAEKAMLVGIHHDLVSF